MIVATKVPSAKADNSYNLLKQAIHIILLKQTIHKIKEDNKFMFTIEQIKEAHSKVKSGADFPKYIQELIALGVKNYNCFVSDGHIEYFGENGFEINSAAKYDEIPVAENANIEQFKNNLKIHQNGETDYMTFCNHCGETGVEKWKVDTVEMTCIYFDKKGNQMLTEDIPS